MSDTRSFWFGGDRFGQGETVMKDKEKIKEKLSEAKEESSEALVDSYNDKEISGVNRGAMYGWVEALEWVLGDDSGE